jgi:hypothetical protein
MLGYLDLPLIKYGETFKFLGLFKRTSKKTKFFSVFGGPYVEKPEHMVGVKMAVEVPFFDDGSIEIDVPTRDYNVPDKFDLADGLEEAGYYILQGRPVYIGCMGGKGRTGLFMAVLAKAFGIANPVAYVRAEYYAHAVETAEQKKYVEDFVIPPRVLSAIKVARRLAQVNPRRYKTNVPREGAVSYE